MEKNGILKIFAMALILAICISFSIVPMAQAQVFPASFNFINPSYYVGYGYYNSINGYLLEFAPFTPFLSPGIALTYNTFGIPTYPYFGSPYQTTFPYATLPGTPIPYARFDYPTYAYGDPGFYLGWVLLQ